MKYLLKMVITAMTVVICSYLMSGIHVKNFLTALVVSIVLSLLNTFLKPLLIVLTIPITIFTLGIFLLFINAIIIYFTDVLIDGFQVDSVWWAIGLSIILAFVNSTITVQVIKDDKD